MAEHSGRREQSAALFPSGQIIISFIWSLSRREGFRTELLTVHPACFVVTTRRRQLRETENTRDRFLKKKKWRDWFIHPQIKKYQHWLGRSAPTDPSVGFKQTAEFMTGGKTREKEATLDAAAFTVNLQRGIATFTAGGNGFFYVKTLLHWRKT